MNLKTKNEMTGLELMHLEEIIFPVIMSMEKAKDNSSKAEMISNLVTEKGKDIVILCYKDANNNPLKEVNQPYMMKLTMDIPKILEYVTGENGEQEEGKQVVQKIKRK